MSEENEGWTSERTLEPCVRCYYCCIGGGEMIVSLEMRLLYSSFYHLILKSEMRCRAVDDE